MRRFLAEHNRIAHPIYRLMADLGRCIPHPVFVEVVEVMGIIASSLRVVGSPNDLRPGRHEYSLRVLIELVHLLMGEGEPDVVVAGRLVD